MGKQYLRYENFSSFGCIFSSGNVIYDSTGKNIICPALEVIKIWNARQGTLVAVLNDPKNTSKVSYLTRFQNILAAGYQDGSVRLWNSDSLECYIRFNGHKSAISSLIFNSDGNILVSGSKDTDIIVWDLVGELGLYKLKGHKDQITGLVFLGKDFLLSSSKDTLIKIWFLTSKFCVETVVGHRSEIWSVVLFQNNILISGSSESELKVWEIDFSKLESKLVCCEAEETPEISSGNDKRSAVTLIGHLNRNSKDRVVSLAISSNQRILVCGSSDRSLEFFHIRNSDEMKKLIKKKSKKANDQEPVVTTPLDYFVSKRFFRTKSKITSFEFCNIKEAEPVKFVVGLVNNAATVFRITEGKDVLDIDEVSSVDINGHRSEIKAVSISSDDSLILTVCDSDVKVWNSTTGNCIRSLPPLDASPTDCVFLPGNHHAVVSTKSGKLFLYDCQASILLETIDAHSASISSLDLRSDKMGIMTGSSDKTVKFWNFGAMEDLEYSKTARRLTLVHTRTLELAEEVRCIRYSLDLKYIAVALLDSTVKVFYNDTLKFFLSLYGHKLPVNSIDFSSDGSLLVTGSADKNIKLWGLDFGDCHRSILSHEDSVTSVRFVTDTHYFFSCSKDKSLRYFDGDNFQQIMVVGRHLGEIKSMCLGKWGSVVVTVGQDKCIKAWRKTDEPLFIEEEREKEMEEEIEKDLENNEEGAEIGKQTIASLKSGERLLEALMICEEHWDKIRIYRREEGKIPKPDLHPLVRAADLNEPEEFAMNILQKIKYPDLDSCLWTTPFSKVITLLSVILFCARRKLNNVLCTRILCFLLRNYLSQLRTSNIENHEGLSVRVILLELRQLLLGNIKEEKDRIGFNLAGLRVINSYWEQEHVSEMAENDEIFERKFQEMKLKGKKTKKRPIS